MRKASDCLVAMLAALCATISIAILLGVVFVVAQRGAPVLSWSFFTEQIRLVGAAGGILWNLVGTMILLAAAFTLCTPFAVSIALVESVWLQRDHARHAIRLALYTLNGLPSIVFGLFGFIVLVQWCGLGKSWLAGGVALALSILPTVAVATLERLHAVPARYVEAASALGLNRSQLIWSVLLPQAWGGVITGSLLGLARAAGETAPIMFTATIFSGATWPHAIRESPVLTLPYHIFILAQDSFDPAVGAKLWGAALVLLALVFLLSLLALPARLKMHEEANV
jgi:phosphate transport system permease protein